ncbi:hypothetical protein BGY98DRAFT_934875 [Russula aff. rugulosa BPL654]|nr:hypothetical protein BGY98DRAFT_934875 [Russula aff. rugulosa BPL654]
MVIGSLVEVMQAESCFSDCFGLSQERGRFREESVVLLSDDMLGKVLEERCARAGKCAGYIAGWVWANARGCPAVCIVYYIFSAEGIQYSIEDVIDDFLFSLSWYYHHDAMALSSLITKVSLGDMIISILEMGECRSLTVYPKDPDACNAIHVGDGQRSRNPEHTTAPEYSNWACISMTEI